MRLESAVTVAGMNERPQAISAAGSGKCNCRGNCGSHKGPCTMQATTGGKTCKSCTTAMKSSFSDTKTAPLKGPKTVGRAPAIVAGGPGSGRHVEEGFKKLPLVLQKALMLRFQKAIDIAHSKTSASVAAGGAGSGRKTESGKIVKTLANAGFTHLATDSSGKEVYQHKYGHVAVHDPSNNSTSVMKNNEWPDGHSLNHVGGANHAQGVKHTLENANIVKGK